MMAKMSKKEGWMLEVVVLSTILCGCSLWEFQDAYISVNGSPVKSTDSRSNTSYVAIQLANAQ